MSKNGLKVTVDHENFAEKNTNEKLDLIYQAVVNQQKVCTSTVKSFNERFEAHDKHIDNSVNLPRRNRKIDLGIGAGTGTVGGAFLIKAVEFIKSYISGG